MGKADEVFLHCGIDWYPRLWHLCRVQHILDIQKQFLLSLMCIIGELAEVVWLKGFSWNPGNNSHWECAAWGTKSRCNVVLTGRLQSNLLCLLWEGQELWFCRHWAIMGLIQSPLCSVEVFSFIVSNGLWIRPAVRRTHVLWTRVVLFPPDLSDDFVEVHSQSDTQVNAKMSCSS